MVALYELEALILAEDTHKRCNSVYYNWLRRAEAAEAAKAQASLSICGGGGQSHLPWTSPNISKSIDL